ncbi:hypothetical protein F4779DRAFT_65689 [Xylariaceae sp. FL0662B]|nr:hypothetical protein F4779DRAFT_65689 [Xylariaceae sp. FL0662B]
MYRRIFPTPMVRWGTVVLGTLVALWFLSITLVIIFQCSPVAKAWKTEVDGTRINLEYFFIGNSIPNILTDLAIICLPVYEVRKLQINKSEKVGLVIVFLLGGLVVIVSIIRLKVLVDTLREGLDADFTKEMNQANIWTVVEPSIGIISASAPLLRPLITMARQVFGRSNPGSHLGIRRSTM